MLSIGCCACAPPASSEPAPQPFEGGSIARGHGVTLQHVAYLPNDRRQSFGLVEDCEAGDGPSCGAHAWAPDEVQSLEAATAELARLSGFEARVEAGDPEVRVHARSDGPPDTGCLDGEVTCWFGATGCAEPGGVLLDASGTPVSDGRRNTDGTLRTCSRWTLELALANIYAWADFLGLERRHVLRGVLLHEMGHTLGLAHQRSGLMRAHLPVCYFIDPGDARDRFDPESDEQAFQRFECLEGVQDPALASRQRALLDAFRGGNAGWSLAPPL